MNRIWRLFKLHLTKKRKRSLNLKQHLENKNLLCKKKQNSGLHRNNNTNRCYLNLKIKSDRWSWPSKLLGKKQKTNSQFMLKKRMVDVSSILVKSKNLRFLWKKHKNSLKPKSMSSRKKEPLKIRSLNFWKCSYKIVKINLKSLISSMNKWLEQWNLKNLKRNQTNCLLANLTLYKTSYQLNQKNICSKFKILDNSLNSLKRS